MDDAYKTPAADLDASGVEASRYPLSRYLWRFTGWYSLLTVIDLGLTASGIDTGSAISVLITMLCAWLAGRRFILDNGRLPTGQEQRVLIWRSMVVILLVGVLAFLVLLMTLDEAMRDQLLAAMTSMPVWIWPLAIIIGFGFSWLALWFGYGKALQRTFEKYQKRNAS